jgi:hypothetical protein
LQKLNLGSLRVFSTICFPTLPKPTIPTRRLIPDSDAQDELDICFRSTVKRLDDAESSLSNLVESVTKEEAVSMFDFG